MKNLGKIILLFLIFKACIFANALLILDKNTASIGEKVVFSIEVQSENVKFPDIREIEGSPIISRGSLRKREMKFINNISSNVEKIIAQYSFIATKDVTIGPFEVEIDGKKFKTKKLKLKIKAKDTNDDILKVDLKLDKNDLKVAQNAIALLSISISNNANIANINFKNKLQAKHFWIQQIGKQEQIRDENQTTINIKYSITPQKAGDFSIDPVGIQAQLLSSDFDNTMQDNFPFSSIFNSSFNNFKTLEAYSLPLRVHVSPLPEGLEIFGDFKMKVKLDKTHVNANEPVNMSVIIEGNGNINDIEKFDISLNDAMVYANEPEIKTQIKNDKFGGIWTQKIAFISDKNFTIPKLEFSFFDEKTQSKKTLSHEKIDILVKANKQVTIHSNTQETPKNSATTKEIQKNESSIFLYFFILMLGVFIGVFLMLFKGKIRSKKADTTLVKKLKQTHSDKQLFDLLMPFGLKYAYIEEILAKLEANIYRNEKNKIDKKAIIDFFQNL